MLISAARTSEPRTSGLLIALITFHAVFLISPLVYFLGFRASLVIPSTVVMALLAMSLHHRRLPHWVLLFVIASLVTSAISGVYWGSLQAALFPAYFGISLIVAVLATEKELRIIVSIGSVILLAFLIGGWIALALAFSGVPPIDTVSGLHDRVLYIYFATLTPTLIGDFIRPSGIYDEPGALSFFVAGFAFLRHWMRMDRKLTWILLILGFVTFSLAHLIYVAIHFMSERRLLVAWLTLIPVTAIAIWVLFTVGLWETFDARLVGRLSVATEPGKTVEGDNRTEFILNAVDALEAGGPRMFLFGVDAICIEGSIQCRHTYPGYEDNVLSPLAYYGLLISWPYYFLLAASIAVGSIRRSWWPLLGVGLLFMQRPNIFVAGYAMLAALVLVVVVRSLENRSQASHTDKVFSNEWRPADGRLPQARS